MQGKGKPVTPLGGGLFALASWLELGAKIPSILVIDFI